MSQLQSAAASIPQWVPDRRLRQQVADRVVEILPAQYDARLMRVCAYHRSGISISEMHIVIQDAQQAILLGTATQAKQMTAWALDLQRQLLWMSSGLPFELKPKELDDSPRIAERTPHDDLPNVPQWRVGPALAEELFGELRSS